MPRKRTKIILPIKESPEPLWTVADVAVALGVRQATVRQYCWMRRIPFLKFGRVVRFRPSVIHQLLAEAERPARPR
jgi:excisionase family DNA binding protein